MPQSLAQVYLHIVFSTKGRADFLTSEDIRRETHAYLGGICRNLESPALAVGGDVNHVHLLCVLSRNQTISDLVRDLKRSSSKWLKTKSPALARFHWQDGFGAFSISPSHLTVLKRYIATQEEHHRKITFQDEYRALLQKYGIAIDEKHIWD